MVRILIKTGLAIVIVTMLVMLFAKSESFGVSSELVRNALYLGAALCVVGVALGVLLRVANITQGRRCPRCRRPVARGRVYCEDHFQQTLHDARDRTALK